MRTGITYLPLHYGKAPKWLFDRMVKLSRQIIIAMVTERGPDDVLFRLSDPYWFQAFGCVLGFDWHSSGLTTTACGALKEGLRGLNAELGIFVAGGKGGASRKTPDQIKDFVEKFNPSLNGELLVYASRMSAKVDNTALQDGYQLYHHNFIFTKSGLWAVVQQGMDESTRWARRYHWLSADVSDFVCEPEKAICCDQKRQVFNMVAKESDDARVNSTTLSREHPESLVSQIKRLETLRLPAEHAIFFKDLKLDTIKKVLISTYERQPSNFEELLGLKGVGPKTIRALALLSELIYGSNVSRRDPARYSFAHGGKDGHPYPVDKAIYDRSINVLRSAINDAKLGRTEKVQALKRLAKA